MNKVSTNRTSKVSKVSKAEKIDNLLRKMQFGLGYDPLVELVSIAKKPSTTTLQKIKIATELMTYVYPKIKAVATDPNMGDVINITVQYDDKESAKTLESALPAPLSKEELEERISMKTDNYKTSENIVYTF